MDHATQTLDRQHSLLASNYYNFICWKYPVACDGWVTFYSFIDGISNIKNTPLLGRLGFLFYEIFDKKFFEDLDSKIIMTWRVSSVCSRFFLFNKRKCNSSNIYKTPSLSFTKDLDRSSLMVEYGTVDPVAGVRFPPAVLLLV